MAELPVKVEGEAGAIPVGTVEWYFIDCAASNKMSGSFHLECVLREGGTRPLGVYPVTLLALGTAGILAGPGGLSMAEGSAQVAVAGVDDYGNDLEVDVQFLHYFGLDTVSP